VSTLLHRLGGVYRDPARVSRDSSKLLKSPVGSNLSPSISPLIQNTGEETPPVLVFSGTVSMSYKGGTYNIPVDVYLPPPYPVRPPVCFVRPTAGMMIKENHRHVAPDGMVYMPYLHEWRPHTHNLVEMVVMMSSLFGSSPPVFAKPAGSSSGNSSNSRPSHRPTSSATSATSYASSAASTSSGPPSYDAARQEAEALAASRREEEERIERERLAAAELQRAIDESRNKEERKRREEERERANKRREEERARVEAENAKRRLTAKLQNGLQRLYHETRAEIQEDLRDQTKLERGSKDMDGALTDLRRRKEELEAGVERIDDATSRIQAFLEGAAEIKSVEQSPDEMANPGDVHSAQMLKLAAENMAISDALYFLDRALARGRVDLPQHMKKVRRLAKRQFLVRAHLMKIAQVRASQRKGAC